HRTNTKLAPQVSRRLLARIAKAARGGYFGPDPTSRPRVTDIKTLSAVQTERLALTFKNTKGKSNHKGENQASVRAETPTMQDAYPSPPCTSHRTMRTTGLATDPPLEDVSQPVQARGRGRGRAGRQHIARSRALRRASVRGAQAGNAGAVTFDEHPDSPRLGTKQSDGTERAAFQVQHSADAENGEAGPSLFYRRKGPQNM
ncbi:hypothetical protein LTS18_014847, partial [Coniosporium uncinatum]